MTDEGTAVADEDLLFPGSFPTLFDGRPPPAPGALLVPPRGSPSGSRGSRPGVPTRVVALAGAAALATAGYTVQPGDTISELSQRFDVSARRLAQANSIVDLDRIYVGQRLSIPGRGGRSDGSRGRRSARRSSARQAGPVPDRPRYHVVQRGETLGGIAGRYGLRTRALARANDISDPGLILAGSRLRLHDAPATPRPTSTTGTHRVRRGETLSEIAARHDVGLAELAAANDLADPDLILPGTRLRIPGGWHCPVPSGKFVDDFGYVKPDGRVHEGIDLFAPRGTRVRAPVPGTLRRVRGSVGGKQFFLEGDDDVLYIGTHMAAFSGSPGRVRAGDVVGRVGNSGNARATSPHLHFEIERDGEDVNPFPLLVDSCR